MADRINQNSPDNMNRKAQAGKAIQSKGRLLITIFIVTLVMVYAVLGMGYLKQGEEQAVLTTQISEAMQTLREIPKPPEDLEQQLAAAQTSLVAEQSSFPSKINTTQVINTILELGNSCGVKATPMVTQPWSTEMIGQHNYQVLRLSVVVEGSFPQLMTFTSELEKGEYATLVIENFSATWGTEQSEEGIIPITGSLKLAIYTR